MGLGSLHKDWKEVYERPRPPAKPDMAARQKAMIALVVSMPAQTYFMKTHGSVYVPKVGGLDADILVSCDTDFLNAVPEGAAFRAFSKEGGDLGYVGPNSLKVLEPCKTGDKQDVTPTLRGLTYQHVGSHANKQVYARLDRLAIGLLHAGSGFTQSQFNVYEQSMQKGVISSGGSGSDGIKNEGKGTWVIKITISMGSANEMDNVISPLATIEQESETAIYLNFNQLANRHAK